MKRILLLTFTALLMSCIQVAAQERMQHPVSTAHIVGMDGRTELVFDEPLADSFTINVLDLTGKSMFTQFHPASEDGCTTIEIPVENLRKGIYMVQVMSGDGKTKTLKLQRN
jgi:methionine-rich copper-binding protein CopC